jgi:hypothetical protein
MAKAMAREAAPFVERGRQPKTSVPGAALEKRHCQSGKYAFEKAKLGIFLALLSFYKCLPKVNKFRF